MIRIRSIARWVAGVAMVAGMLLAAGALSALNGFSAHAQGMMRAPGFGGAGGAGRGGFIGGGPGRGGFTNGGMGYGGRMAPYGGTYPDRESTFVPAVPSARDTPDPVYDCRYDARGACSNIRHRHARTRPHGHREVPAANAGGAGGLRQTSGGRDRDRARRNGSAAVDTRSVDREILVEVTASQPREQATSLARRLRLTTLESQDLALTGSTIYRWRIGDNRSVDTVLRQLGAHNSGTVRSAQRNFRYTLQQQGTAASSSGDDPTQYVLEKMHLPEAHVLAQGTGVTIAVIDSGIDADNPELAGSISTTFDALGGKPAPHPHGTGVAGAIAAHARLMGSAPGARILAIRAFNTTRQGTETTSFVILKSLDYAAEHRAQVVNMSFAGPPDSLLQRSLKAAAGRGIVLVAAAGNGGPKAPPSYPAAAAEVIAVSATDASDQAFRESNQGPYIAVAAPGVDLLLPAPNAKYQIVSGTSFSAAYVSGLIGLMLQRNASLTPADIRSKLEASARDIGPKGRDDQFGAGLADALAAVQAVTPALSAEVATPAVAQPVKADGDSVPADQGGEVSTPLR